MHAPRPRRAVSYDEFKEAVSKEPILADAIFRPLRRFASGRGFVTSPLAAAAAAAPGAAGAATGAAAGGSGSA